jgi:putative phosphoesterase
MRIGILSDTHIPDKAEELPIEILQAFKDVDMVIHAGDILELSVLDKLRSVCKNVRAVCGNMDPHALKKVLAEKEIIEIGRYRIGVMHGYGHPNKLIELLKEKFKNDNVDVIIFGHSHSGLNEKIGNTLFFNPGSATDKLFAVYNSYGIMEIGEEIEARIIKI